MKRIKKYNRFASIILILSLLMVTFAGCKKIDKNTTKDNDGLVTRGAWISWLGETFGMDTYDNATSYYNDIKSDNPIFNYVQSCYEWGVLSKGAKAFKPDDKASLGFIVSTAVLAAELDYSGYKGDSDNEKIINCAADFALCEGLKYDTEILNASVDELSAALILKAAQQAYLNKPYEEHEDVVMNPEVVDLKETEITVTNQETGDCVLSGEVASTLSVGKVFIEPASAEFPCGRAVKVVSITTNEDGTCTVITEEPELGEVFEKIDIEKEIDTVTPEMVKCVEGVELVDIETASNNANMAQLAYVVPNSKIEKMATFSFKGSDTLKFKVDMKNGGFKVENKLSGDLSGNSEGWFDGLLELEKKQTLVEDGDDGTFKGENKTSHDDLADKISKILLNNENINDVKEFSKQNNLAYLYNQLDPSDNISLFEDAEEDLISKYKKHQITKDELDEELKKKRDELLRPAKATLAGNKSVKYEAGYSIIGGLDLSVYAKATVKTEWTKIKSVAVNYGYDIKPYVKLNGKFEGSISICRINIPIATGLDIALEVIIKADANGDLEFSAKISNDTQFEYTKGNTKKTSDASTTLLADLKIEAYLGAGIKGTLRCLGLKLMDVSATVGDKAEFEAKAELKLVDTKDNKGRLISTSCVTTAGVSGSITAPIIRIEGGGKDTAVGKLGVSFKLDIDRFATKIELPASLMKEKVLFEILYDYSCLDGIIDEVNTTVDDEKNTFKLGSYGVELKVGESISFDKSSLTDDQKNNVLAYEVTNHEVISIDRDGKVTGLKAGSSNVKISTYDEKLLGEVTIKVVEN